MVRGPRSYMVSALAAIARGMDATAFVEKYPHHWLLWEPGHWQPPRGQTIQASADAIKAMLANATAEALALSLPDPDGTPGSEELVLGRAPECALAINDGTLSSRHLAFTRSGPNWQVRDVGSKNGSTVDGALLPTGLPVLLRPGARIQAGQVTLTFYSPEGMYTRLAGG